MIEIEITKAPSIYNEGVRKFLRNQVTLSATGDIIIPEFREAYLSLVVEKGKLFLHSNSLVEIHLNGKMASFPIQLKEEDTFSFEAYKIFIHRFSYSPKTTLNRSFDKQVNLNKKENAPLHKFVKKVYQEI